MRPRPGALLSPVVTLLLLLSPGGPLHADETVVAVPLKVQAAILKKMMGYDKTLPKGVTRVLVVTQEPKQGLEAQSTFTGLGMPATVVKPEAALGKLTHETLVYMLPDGYTSALGNACVANKVLIATGTPVSVRIGEAGIGIGFKSDGRPEMIVNLVRTRALGHDFSAQLLTLATIVN